jgi:signal transduction histidine kinase
MTTHPHRTALGEASAFLLRRFASASHAAVLLALLLVTTLGLQLVRAVVVELWAIVSRAARAIARWRQGTSRSEPEDPQAEHDETESAIFDRWRPAVNERALLALCAAAQRERHDIGRFRQTTIYATYRVPPDRASPPPAAVMLRDPAMWRDLSYWMSAIGLSLFTAIAVATAWLGPVGVIGMTLLFRIWGPDPAPDADYPDWLASFSTADGVLLVGLVVAVALLAPQATRAAAAFHAGLGVALLSPSGQARLEAELAEQRARRRLAVEAAEAERRRIERDLHDGAQQRLITLAMNLGMARRKFATDPTGAEELVAEAHAEAKQALGELRTLARGIHPAVLTDRGLDAALSAIAGRVGVPIDVTVELDRRPPTAVESAAYFVVAEALTNVARHAAATRASVSVTGGDEQVVVEITDDGVGGADLANGTGLSGLSDRVGSIDGSLEVLSPPGGPTVVRAELPCAS